MTKVKKVTASVKKVGKGCYKVKLPKCSPKTKSSRGRLASSMVKVMIDAIPIPVVAYGQVNADGGVDSIKTSCNLRVWRISRGWYRVEFNTDRMIRSVLVQVRCKPRSRRVCALVKSLIRHRIVPNNLNPVEIFLTTVRGAFVDCPFDLIALTDGALVTEVPVRPVKKVK
jgi:hypothetical protein